ncbi:MAG: hypothetical protein IK125_09415, partial [Lachnospiraceae bacterium]|nr:hypothetical protein [Lachnospiraceae bacterium]
MIYFVCALSAEAAPFLRIFDLEKRRMPYRYEVYESRVGAQVKARLTVSGIGSFHASCAAAFLFGLYPPGPDDLLVNVGICGASPSLSGAERGSIYQCGKILKPDGADSVYPAVRTDLPWEVATLQTSEQVVTENETTTRTAYPGGCCASRAAVDRGGRSVRPHGAFDGGEPVRGAGRR